MANQPKKYTKFVAAAATATLVASAIVPVASAAGFSDVADTNSHAVNINALAEAGIIGGYPDGTFKPNQELTRGQVVKMLGKWVEAQGFEIPADYATKARFTDLAADAKDQELVKYAALVFDTGVFAGSNGALNAGGKITRENMALVLDRAFKAINDTTLVEVAAEIEDVKVADLATAKAEAREAIQALRNLGISGVENFMPKDSVTRAQFATFLNKTINTEVAPVELTLTSAVATSATTLEVVLSDESKHVVTLEKALEANKETEVTFKIEETEYTAKVTYVVEELLVEEVKAINAKELTVTFNNSIKKDTVIESNGTLVDGTITLTSLDGSAVTVNSALATLSEDGRTLTLQAPAAEVFNGRYDVAIAKGAFKSAGDKEVEKFETTTGKFEDKVAPSITGTTKVTSTQVKVNFSEPVNEADAASLVAKATFKYADGTAIDSAKITGSVLSADKKSLTIGLGDADIVVGKEIVVTFIGVKDFAGNIIAPNPATVTIQKGNKDGVAPTVVDVKAVNNKALEVKFSEELVGNPTVTGVSGTLTYTQDKNDKTKYKVETTEAQTGLKSVTVSAGYTDLSGETGVAFTKVVNFDTDTVAPKLVATNIVKGTDNAEYLELTFDEEVTKSASLSTIAVTGTKVKDYVTTGVTVTVPTAKLVVDADNKKVATIKLTDLLAGADVEGAVYDLTLTGKNADATPATVAMFEDISANAGASSLKASFTRNKDGVADSNQKATIDTTVGTNGITVDDNNTVTVNFNQELDGATATDVNNYKIDGTVVEKAVLNAAVDGKQTVTLTLKADSNTFTGERNVTISNVKAKNGVVMDTYNTTEVLKENVAPTITKAVLTDVNKITVTFSEAVTNAEIDSNDFELNIGGVKVATNDTITTAAQTTAATTLVLTLEAAVTADDISKGLTIKALNTIDVKDVAENKVVAPVTVTVAQ
ncbi:S-layer homology domain-containing protein [Solibacillus sp. NPDC093137]|uniref:S-layer homology domain-containing protein n=1 Tax=Solibacillus sp. NPDC093137 TaxID=3390678 RepID=UPI003D02400A